MQLFRQQAIDHQHQLYGEVLLVPPLRWSVIGLLLSGLIATAALFLLLGTYNPTITARGVIRQSGHAELHVSPSAMGQIVPGQNVRLMLSDYPGLEDNDLRGTIERIGSRPKDNSPYVAVTIRFDPLKTQDPHLLARADLPINALIVLPGRSLLAWRLDPAGTAAQR